MHHQIKLKDSVFCTICKKEWPSKERPPKKCRSENHNPKAITKHISSIKPVIKMR